MIEVVAEIGLNHNGDLSLVQLLIETAAKAGCDWVKFQKRTPELCVPEHMKKVLRETPWGTMSYMDYRNHVELSGADYSMIDMMCTKAGIKWFASAFDIKAARFLAHVCPESRIKIPSAKITDMELLNYCRETFDTVIMSTGMSTEQEIEDAVHAACPTHIMHCHAAYPAPTEELNLQYIIHLKEKYPDKIIGYSGHEYGLVTTFAAATLGADIIERHLTLNRDLWGSDQKSSVEPDGLRKLVKGIRCIEEASQNCSMSCGRVVLPSEEAKRKSLRG